MTPGRSDIELVQGDDFVLEFDYVDANDDPINMTGWFVQVQVRESADETSPILSGANCSNTNGGVVVTLGHVSCRITGDFTKDWTNTNAVYQVKMTPGGNPRYTPLMGDISVIPRVVVDES